MSYPEGWRASTLKRLQKAAAAVEPDLAVTSFTKAVRDFRGFPRAKTIPTIHIAMSFTSAFLSILLVAAWIGVVPAMADAPGELWLTDPYGSARLERQKAPVTFEASTEADSQLVIEVRDDRTYQIMDGFGYTLTGGSAMHLMAMSAPARDAILRELFDTNGTAIGVSYLRVSIGASDLNARVFSYDDLPPGQTDPQLTRFSLGPDLKDVVPVLLQILAIQPGLKIMGSPWSPPAWMKTNRDTRGGSLKREYFGAYARYFVKYIQAMKREGIVIDTITIQNEPLNPDNNPSLLMLAADQAEFIKRHLGPAFRAAGITTKIICYDHNADRIDYPLAILNDPEAKQYVDGSAFHLYAGDIDQLAIVRDAHPDRNLYFTEQWIGAPGNLAGDLGWHMKHVVIGATRNGCRTVLEWNLAANSQHQPHTDRGGCDRCLGAITIDGDKITRNPAYYIIAHASRFVRPGSVRIGSTGLDSLPNVAFRTPENRTVLIIINPGGQTRACAIRSRGATASISLPAAAAATVVW